MARNGKIGDSHRNGAISKRSQVFNPKTIKWVKINTDNGQFMDSKSDYKPFKDVRREKRP